MYKQMEKFVNVNIIKNYMKKNNLTQAKFCKKCNIGATTLRTIFASPSTCKIRTIMKIAKAIDIPFYKFYETIYY